MSTVVKLLRCREGGYLGVVVGRKCARNEGGGAALWVGNVGRRSGDQLLGSMWMLYVVSSSHAWPSRALPLCILLVCVRHACAVDRLVVSYEERTKKGEKNEWERKACTWYIMRTRSQTAVDISLKRSDAGFRWWIEIALEFEQVSGLGMKWASSPKFEKLRNLPSLKSKFGYKKVISQRSISV